MSQSTFSYRQLDNCSFPCGVARLTPTWSTTQKKQRLELFFKMEKTFNQIAAVADEPQTDVPQNQSTPDETFEAVANLNTILDRSTSPPNHLKVQFFKSHLYGDRLLSRYSCYDYWRFPHFTSYPNLREYTWIGKPTTDGWPDGWWFKTKCRRNIEWRQTNGWSASGWFNKPIQFPGSNDTW